MGINLGRFEICLNVANINKSIEFYKKLGLTEIGGDQSKGWSILKHSNFILGLFMGHIDNNLLHFRGEDIFQLEKELMRMGLTSKIKAHIEECDNSPSMEFEDPDNNLIYFNTAEDEPVINFDIQKLPSEDNKHPLGRFEMCLSCQDLSISIGFYQKLGFEKIDGNPEDEGWVILKHNNGIIALYNKETINTKSGQVLNFRGGDVESITNDLKKQGLVMKIDFKAGKNGGGSTTLLDPDGNVIFLDTAPDEPRYEFNIDKL
jgi:catechol 2,3-dioxygenase-like lactoylglutathione lyase family enzyme